ncbi:MAG: lipoate--protein ligase [Planctomycetota bacterium]
MIYDAPGAAAWNMAVDEALLERAAVQNRASLRFYTWREPTLSLGFFQRMSDVAACDRLASLPAVRRMSGGGALLHDREITYSLALPASHHLAGLTDDLYRTVHQVWIDQFADILGVATRLFESTEQAVQDATPERDRPLLCFHRRAPFDVVAEDARAPLGAAKLIGSAQRRRRGAVLQHGAVLLSASSHTPELLGIQDLSERKFPKESLSQTAACQLLGELGLDLDEETETAWREAVDRLAREKYDCEDWTSRR